MDKSGLNKFYWGFIFIMLSIRIQGFDVLPNIVGYLFFASGFIQLASSSTYFSIAAKYNILIIILSLFQIYQTPAQGGGINLGSLGIITIPIVMASFVFNLLVVYNLFIGIKDMANKRKQFDLVKESNERWNQYKMLQIAALFSYILIIIPPLAVFYVIVLFVMSIILTIVILGFLKRCSESLSRLT